MSYTLDGIMLNSHLPQMNCSGNLLLSQQDSKKKVFTQQSTHPLLALNGTWGNRASRSTIKASTRARDERRIVDLADGGAAREGRDECGGKLLLLSGAKTKAGRLGEGKSCAAADRIGGGEVGVEVGRVRS